MVAALGWATHLECKHTARVAPVPQVCVRGEPGGHGLCLRGRARSWLRGRVGTLNANNGGKDLGSRAGNPGSSCRPWLSGQDRKVTLGLTLLP